jgi:hypothetical protein
MTDILPERQSRRRFTGLGVTGRVALIANALGRPSAVRAGVDGDLLLGQPNSAVATTGISSSGTGAALDLASTNDTG